MENLIDKKLTSAIQLANEKLINGLSKLNYFDDVNFINNGKSLKRVVVDDVTILGDGQLAIYVMKQNKIVIDGTKISDNVDVNFLALLILHEYIHMCTADLKNNRMGFEDASLPVTYNEACTQYLALKLFYGDNNLDEVIAKNVVYKDSVILLYDAIKELNEEIIFNGFFEANIKKNINSMTGKEKNKWLDYILKFSNSNEEKSCINSMKQFQEKIELSSKCI